MSYWSEAPLVRLVPSFVGGILCGLYFEIHHTWLLSSILVAVTLLWLMVKGLKWKYNHRWQFGVMAHLAIALTGWYITNVYCELKSPNHFSNYVSTASILLVHIDEQPHEKAKTIKAIVKVEAVYENTRSHLTKGNLVVYFPKDSNTKTLQYGDCVLIRAQIDTIQAPLNPYEFNYKQYLGFHNIYHQVFVKNSGWIKRSVNHSWWMKRWAYSLRDKLLAVFQQYLSGNEYTVAASLIAGYVDNIDHDLILAYANTGVLHVLSVSGMHVAVIYIAISRLLAFTERKRSTSIAKNIVVIAFLWFYACITGFSPAVLRATFMLTLVISGKILNRESNIYNALAASALVLLFINPYLIADIGFQLSYLSIVGIVILQPGIYNLFFFKNWLVDKVWELTSTSIAAQVAVLPITLFYFQRFPNYFIPTNLLVIPLSTVAIYSGIGLLLVSGIPMLSTLAGKITWVSVKSLNYVVFFFNTLPGAILSGLCLNSVQTIFLYLSITLLVGFFIMKRHLLLAISLISFILVLSIANYQAFQHAKQSKFIVYGIPKSTAIDFTNGNTSFIINNSDLSDSAGDYNYHIVGNHHHSGITHVNFTSFTNHIELPYLWINKNLIQWKTQRIGIIENATIKGYNVPNYPIPIDYMVLSGNPKLKIADLLAFYRPKQVIADLSNNRYCCERWERECEKLHLAWYNVARKGAFIAVARE